MIATRGQSGCPKFLCTVCTFVSQEKLICGRILLAGETSEDIIDKSIYTFFFSFYKNLCSLLLHISTRLGNEVIFSLVFNKSLSIYTDTEKLYKQWFQLTHKLVLHVFVKQALQNHKYTTSWLLLLHWKYANQYVLFFSLSLDLNF